MTKLATLAVPLFISLLTACSTTPSVQYYVLEATAKRPDLTGNQSLQPALASGKPHTVGIGPVSIPSLLINKKIVTREAENRVKIAEFQHWGAPLQDQILMALTQNLTAMQPQWVVWAYPWSAHGIVNLQVIVDITRFDAQRGESAQLEANWTIKREENHALVTNGHSLIRRSVDGSSYSSLVQAMNQCLAGFSQELAFALVKAERYQSNK